MNEPLKRRWPRVGATPEQIFPTIRDLIGKDIRWGRDLILGFPSMSPSIVGLQAFLEAVHAHCNNILTSTRGRGENGFEGTQELERQTIYMLAELMGAASPQLDVDGYIASGGTEANDMGLWIGRNLIRSGNQSARIVVLATGISHYSLPKACNVLDLGEGSWEECPSCKHPHPGKKLRHVFKPGPSGLRYVAADGEGRISLVELSNEIDASYRDGVRGFIIFLSAGTTMTGAMDDWAGVGALVAEKRSRYGDARFYVHVDAAYGGFVFPFLHPELPMPFRTPEVDSITLDPYKMGMGPLAQGIFLCRKHRQRYIERPTGYVHDEMDDTLCGSRTGAHAAAVWATINNLGTEGYTALHRGSEAKASQLAVMLREVPGIRVIGPHLNVVTVELLETPTVGQETSLVERIQEPMRVMGNWMSFDPQNTEAHAKRLLKCCITGDTKPEWFGPYVETLKKILSDPNGGEWPDDGETK